MRKKLFIFSASIFLIIFTYIYLVSRETPHSVKQYEIQFAYPVSSINPSIYDDWESVFIGNHIYYRLLPEKNHPTIPFITKTFSITCLNPTSSSLNEHCKYIQISFKPIEFSDCSGRIYKIEDLRGEFETILNTQKWILVDWKKCKAEKDTICVTGKYAPDQYRRMQNIYFRFGWSKAKKQDALNGAGPYCLYNKDNFKGNINSGILKPRKIENNLPIISFHTSQNKDDQFQLALYGNKNLLSAQRKNVQVHTPLAYYVITHPHTAGQTLPWNTIETKKIIYNYLTKNETFFADIPQFANFSPQGKALTTPTNKARSSGQFEFAIPDYLPGCNNLATLLNLSWRNTNTRALCIDIVKYISKNVIEKKDSWNGFLVGISASDPSRDSIRHEYFSPGLSSSWTYGYPDPDKYFYRVGIGQSLATVDGVKICGIRPNPLGLSDIFITDLLPCTKT